MSSARMSARLDAAHATLRMFIGPDEAHRALCGVLTLPIDTWEQDCLAAADALRRVATGQLSDEDLPR